MTTTTKTKSELSAADLAALFRARNPLIWINTREEGRVERYIFAAAAAAGYVPRTWDCGQGVCNMSGEQESAIGGNDTGDTFNAISDRAKRGSERGVWIMRDVLPWFGNGLAGLAPLRQCRNLARMLPGVEREAAQSIVVLSPSGDVPPELAGHATVIEWPLPDASEIGAILDIAVENSADAIPGLRDSMQNGVRAAAIDAAVGLTGLEAEACYSKSLVQLKRIDPAAVSAEKKRVIAREKVLEWFDPLPGGLDSVGGLDGLKLWLKSRTLAYSPKARAYGLPAPKGMLLVGVPGCGKSLTAKAIATAWGGIPLLRMDLGALKSKFVGESEANLRKALRVIESVGRCIVWLDEIEKALSGATEGGADGGVSADALGAILSWMQDRAGEAFVVATANDVAKLPPELLRKGRFDELFFVDLPNQIEREGVLTATLRKFNRGNVKINARAVAQACDQFTGSEIAELVPEAMFVAFADGEREITSADLVAVARNVSPLSKTSKEKIDRLREWAKGGRARPASSIEAVTETRKPATGRTLDID